MSQDDKAPSEDELPVLTDVVDNEGEVTDRDFDTLVAELQTRLSVEAFELTERLLHGAFQEMEATLFEQVSDRLRQELPEMIDRILREQLSEAAGQKQS